MEITGYIVVTIFKDIKYYYSPKAEKWVDSIEKLYLGDIYVGDISSYKDIKVNMEDYPMLKGCVPTIGKITLKIEL